MGTLLDFSSTHGTRMRTGLNKLSAKQVMKATKSGFLLDGGGLYLQIAQYRQTSDTGRPHRTSQKVSKSWIFRYRDRTTGKLRDIGLGRLLDLSLADARLKASEMRRMLLDGKDPKVEKAQHRIAAKVEAARIITFDEAASKCIADKKPSWRNEKHADQWTSTLATYASPVLGKVPVASIDLPLIRRVLDPIWTTKNETASRVRQRIESVLAWATVSGYRTGDNPARWRGHLDHILPKPSKVQAQEHHPALPYRKIAAFFLALQKQNGIAPAALEFLILTAARTSEVIMARWEEFDLERSLWTIPAERMKARKEHLVPLSPRAKEVVQNLAKAQLGPFVFPGLKVGAPLSNMAMIALLERMGCTDITVHGFRSTFRDWAGEQTSYPRELIEHALAHRLKDKAEAAYARSTLPERRRPLMEDWATYCRWQESKVG
jgi:integrase